MKKMIAIIPTALLTLSSVESASQPRNLDVGEARINYTVSGTGTAIVFIHGWALDLREWHDQVATLSKSFRVIAYDRRGCGKSTGIADVSADPGDLRDLLDSLGIRSAILVGHSAGADVAYRFTAAFPGRVEGLVLYGGPAPQGFPIRASDPQPIGARATIARQYGLDSLFKIVAAQPAFRPGAHRSREIAARLDSIVADYGGKDLLEDHVPSGRFAPARFESVKDWQVPTLFIGGEAEAARWLLVSDSLSHWMPNARRVLIAGGGHGVHFDEPEAFNAALLSFANNVASRRKP